MLAVIHHQALAEKAWRPDGTPFDQAPSLHIAEQLEHEDLRCVWWWSSQGTWMRFSETLFVVRDGSIYNLERQRGRLGQANQSRNREKNEIHTLKMGFR